MTPAKPRLVYVVDDDASVRKAIGRLMHSTGFEVREFASPQESLDQPADAAPTCVLPDITMPEVTGLEVQAQLHARGHRWPVIAISAREDDAARDTSRLLGARFFLRKPVDGELRVAAVTSAFEICRQARAEHTARATIEVRLKSHTAREREVFAHVIAGRPNKQVAGDLGTVEKTIKVHRSRILHKLQVRALAELVRLCGQVGIKPAP